MGHFSLILDASQLADTGTTSAGGLVPTVTDNLFSAGLIGAKQVGISFEPTTSLSVTNGELTFGGVDPSKFNGTLHTLYVLQYLMAIFVLTIVL